MPFIKTYQEFSTLAEKLCKENPTTSRFTTKYDAKGALTLKVTDNATCYMFTTDKMEDLKKSERLSLNLLNIMTA
uniref:Signal recognition particle 9 kDa protein n=1 Tax=Rhabditophanes sp. KR3021 TaxID=114890 RepID=A0AC35UC52_9BILA